MASTPKHPSEGPSFLRERGRVLEQIIRDRLQIVGGSLRPAKLHLRA
jgi:hypothetical protein